jgi:ribosomal protein S16
MASSEAVARQISTSKECGESTWHEHVLSFNMGVALIRGIVLLAALPMQEGTAPRYRIVLTETLKCGTGKFVETHGFYDHFKGFELTKVSSGELPGWILPQACIDSDVVRDVWIKGNPPAPEFGP